MCQIDWHTLSTCHGSCHYYLEEIRSSHWNDGYHHGKCDWATPNISPFLLLHSSHLKEWTVLLRAFLLLVRKCVWCVCGGDGGGLLRKSGQLYRPPSIHVWWQSRHCSAILPKSKLCLSKNPKDQLTWKAFPGYIESDHASTLRPVLTCQVKWPPKFFTV